MAALRCYGNAAYLNDAQVQLMLLWAGIEGLLSVDAELRRRLALYSAILVRGSSEEKSRYYEFVKRGYDVRSRAVHGGKVGKEKLESGVSDATLILSDLLARCVEIGRVPSSSEFDHLAASATFESSPQPSSSMSQ